jgi:hypothetical protein
MSQPVTHTDLIDVTQDQRTRIEDIIRACFPANHDWDIKQGTIVVGPSNLTTAQVYDAGRPVCVYDVGEQICGVLGLDPRSVMRIVIHGLQASVVIWDKA